MAGDTPKRTRAAAAKAQEKEASHPNTPTKQPGKPTMCGHCVSYIFPRHIESVCDKVEGSSKQCSNCNREKKGCAICPDEFKAEIENMVRTHEFYLSAPTAMKESIKPAMVETAKDLSKQIKEAKARRQEAENQKMESVTIALKASNTSNTPAEKANIEIEKAKLDIERAELDIERQRIAAKKEKVSIERAKLEIESTKLAVQREILRLVNGHCESQKESIENLTKLTTNVNDEAGRIAIGMYEMARNFENVVERLAEITKIEMSNDNNESGNSDNNDDKPAAANPLPSSSNLLSPVGGARALSPQAFENIIESAFKRKASEPPETPTPKRHIALDSGPPKSSTPIRKFNDVVDEKMAGK
ncbi:hypothetical protein ACJ73_08860 [Blastomyces percursus]|uniref:Uncharacterized protein n=1 Tax=Blastomyces percursus TaxID=1658174 RepID=A0A1J9Q8X5_9EURO|nr:hypothetical protein ACJ73_08860 [Blastomyces percursus]